MENFREFEILKYRKCIYLINNISSIETSIGQKFQINFYFRITFKEGSKLYKDSFDVQYSHALQYYKNADSEQRQFLIKEIGENFPDFDLKKINSHLINQKIQKIDSLNEEDCIEYLKNRGYLIYKKI